MKKTLVALVLALIFISANIENAKAVGIVIKIGRGISTWNDCLPGNGICFVVILTRSNTSSNLDRAEAGTGIEMIDGTAELKDGKLFVTALKQPSEKARNQQGKFEFAIKEQGVKSQVIIDPAVAKELGVENMAVAPGKYEFNGNTVALRIASPRDVSTGQSSGKRNNIAIDEPGVQKAPKATYDLKENNK